MPALDVRPSPIAGTWYEADPQRLAAQIDEYLAAAQQPPLPGVVTAVIAPHAGHRYSGYVAGYGFAALRGLAPDLVAIVSPFHDFAPVPLLTTKHAAYSTPLGNILVDQSALADLRAQLDVEITPIARDREHSLEIELPFLQRVLKNDFQLLPIMIRAQEPPIARKLGQALAAVIAKRNALLIASTDLSHFHDQETADVLDREMLHRFESLDPESIFDAELNGKGFACGHAAVAAVFWASRALGATSVVILKHATSGDITHDYSSVVGYGTGVVLKPI